MNGKTKKSPLSYVKYYTSVSYLFDPTESRFLTHMIEIDSLHKRGYDTQWTQSDYARRMGLKEYAFKRCVKRFVELNLLTVRYNTQGNRVYYSFNTEMYEKLVAILTVTGHVDRLIEFCDTEFKKGGRPIESITPEEIAALGSENKPKKLHPSMEAIR